MPNSSPSANSSSITDTGSALRSFVKLVAMVTLSGATPSCATTIFFTRSKTSFSSLSRSFPVRVSNSAVDSSPAATLVTYRGTKIPIRPIIIYAMNRRATIALPMSNIVCLSTVASITQTQPIKRGRSSRAASRAY
jgi:hypothetical protein